jgi:hypothetical protein
MLLTLKKNLPFLDGGAEDDPAHQQKKGKTYGYKQFYPHCLRHEFVQHNFLLYERFSPKNMNKKPSPPHGISKTTMACLPTGSTITSLHLL